MLHPLPWPDLRSIPARLPARAQGANRITFTEFERALGLVAEAKGVDVQAVIEAVVQSRGPTSTHMPPNPTPAPTPNKR